MSAGSRSMVLRLDLSATPPISAMTTREIAGAWAVSAPKCIRSVDPGPSASGVTVKTVRYSVPPFSATIVVECGGSAASTIISSVAFIPDNLRVSGQRRPGK